MKWWSKKKDDDGLPPNARLIGSFNIEEKVWLQLVWMSENFEAMVKELMERSVVTLYSELDEEQFERVSKALIETYQECSDRYLAEFKKAVEGQ